MPKKKTPSKLLRKLQDLGIEFSYTDGGKLLIFFPRLGRIQKDIVDELWEGREALETEVLSHILPPPVYSDGESLCHGEAHGGYCPSIAFEEREFTA